ncbi:unnamed protein product [Blepharisma stoltei]|uniref:Uncharacterized protein n=1 Tax=Blepharisma stoltei TaxID=1481888 RepID=A0AAU9JZM1_9CILI|nr:unnamed protein product [Blepharisma stoltei]
MITEFPWNERWLNGSEYEFIIRNYEKYSENFGFQILTDHPSFIYTAPSHGLLYFLKENSLRGLGFPRVKGLRKRYKWKKMNFVTALPKQKPKVQYLVATGRLASVCYRMHIVTLDKKSPLLCHMLRIQSHFKSGIGIPSRRHFKENVLPPFLEGEQNNENSENPELKYHKVPRTIHPLTHEAIMYTLAPFRMPLRDASIFLNNCQYEQLL